MNQPSPLQPGTVIDDYEIIESLWTTNSGFTYLARDLDRGRDVLIREFLPNALATRHWSGIHAMALEGFAQEFDQSLTDFLRQARILAQINDPYVCRVYEYTQANATAYMVLNHEPGQTLTEHLAACDTPLDDGELRKLLVPLLKGLKVVHGAGLLHRDIHPGNIYLRDVGPPVLIGFGSPAVVAHEGDAHVESRIAPGYSPVEQYQSDGVLGPWSDLYALGATMYRCLSGRAPVDAAHRVTEVAQNHEDPLLPATELGVGDYSAGLLSAIDWMMEPMVADRPDSATAVLGPLIQERGGELTPAKGTRVPPHTDPAAHEHRAPRPSGGRTAPAPMPPLGTGRESMRPAPPRRRRRWPWTAVPVALAIAAVLLFYRDEFPSQPDPAPAELAADTVSQATAPAPDTDYPPPELPEEVNFGRHADNLRADQYRDLEVQTREIERLLAAAETRREDGKLIAPPGDNALASYRKVLDIDPDQTDAKLGIAAIQNKLVARAETAFETDQDITAARRLLDQAADIDAHNDRARALREKMEQDQVRREREERRAHESAQRREEAEKRAEQARRNRIRDLNQQADAAFEAGRLTRPPGENALALYREVLRLDPDESQAHNGVARVGETFLDRAASAIARDDLDQAQGLLSTAAAVLPDSQAVGRLREQLDTRRAVLEAKHRDAQRQAALAARQPPEPAQSAEQPETGRENPASAELERGIEAYYAGDYDIAYRLLQPLSEQGQARARLRVAMMYYHGRGLAPDTGRAEALIREALPALRQQVAEGAAWAQADLASLYTDGIVVAENDGEAVRLYRLAAEQGYAGAQTNLGVMYANGEGVVRDRDNAIAWLQRAATQGDRIAERNLRALGVE